MCVFKVSPNEIKMHVFFISSCCCYVVLAIAVLYFVICHFNFDIFVQLSINNQTGYIQSEFLVLFVVNTFGSSRTLFF